MFLLECTISMQELLLRKRTIFPSPIQLSASLGNYPPTELTPKHFNQTELSQLSNDEPLGSNQIPDLSIFTPMASPKLFGAL